MITFKEHIVKVKSGYRLVSKKTGKNLGTYPSRSGAENRERQVQYFKHMGESARLKKTLKALMSNEILRKLSNMAAVKAYNETVLVKKKLNASPRSGPADTAVSTVSERISKYKQYIMARQQFDVNKRRRYEDT